MTRDDLIIMLETIDEETSTIEDTLSEIANFILANFVPKEDIEKSLDGILDNTKVYEGEIIDFLKNYHIGDKHLNSIFGMNVGKQAILIIKENE